MAKARRENTAMILGVVRRNRRSLLMGTALQASVMLVLALPAGAQPAPNARPTGGVVAAGSAAISRTATNTQIDQASQRAAINWRSFDVGRQQSVTFIQPSASAVALNRVTGPDPSQIAGRIDANGQIILVNQSGVNFYKGAQVNAAGVMVSAADITNKNFMAGTMTFDQPAHPNAKIDNQGTITVKQAGLAALVAPQVANSGTISARLGHVVLAGAQTATLDLFGDGLLSLDVSNQVMHAPVGKDGNAATALVTNTGVIIADGGTVQLTARAADGVVQNLVQAGGTIRAATMGDQTGVVALNGIGGSVVVEGQLSAPGLAPGSRGGAIEVTSSHDVVVAASAKIDASGAAGGGVAAIGTTVARAKGGPGVTPTTVARNVTVRRGATVAADATTSGNGGNVTVLSTDTTLMDGLITVRGGAQGGDGGPAEVSGGVVSYTGHVDATAPLGAIGTLLLDPLDLFVSDVQPKGTIAISSPTVAAGGSPDAIRSSWISPAFLAGQSANISLATSQDLFVNSPVVLTGAGQSLTLQAGRNLDVEANLTAPGNIVLNSHTDLTTFAAGALTVNAVVQATGSIFLGGHNLSGIRNPVTGLFDFQTGITIGASGAVRSLGTNPLISIACDCAITASPGSFQAIGGTVEIGPLRPGDSRNLGSLGSFANSSTFVFGLAHNPLTNAPLKDQTITIDPTAPIGATTLDLEAIGNAVQPPGSAIANLGTLVGAVGSATLTGGLNRIGSLGRFTTSTGDFSLTAAGPLSTSGALAATGNVSLQTTGNLTVGSTVTSGGGLLLTAGADLMVDRGVTLTAGAALGLVAGLASTGAPSFGTGSILLGTTGSGAAPVLSAPVIGLAALGAPSTSNPSVALLDATLGNGISGAATAVFIGAAGGITQTTGAIKAGEFDFFSQSAGLTGGNVIGSMFFRVSNDFTMSNAGALTVLPAPTALADFAATVLPTVLPNLPAAVTAAILTPGSNSSGPLILSTTGALTVNGAIATTGATLLNAGTDLTLNADLSVGTPPASGFAAAALGTVISSNPGAITLDAGRDLLIAAPVSVGPPGGSIALGAGRNLTITSPVTSTTGLIAQAGVADAAGTLNVGAGVSGGTGGVLLSSRSEGTTIANFVTGGGITLLSDGPITFNLGASLDTGGGPLEVAPNTPGVAMEAGGTGPGLSFGTLPVVDKSVPPGLVRFGAFTQPQTGTQTTTAGQLSLIGPFYPVGLTVPVLDLHATGAVTQTVPIVNISATGELSGAAGSVTLTNFGNQIDTLGAFNTTAGFALVNNKSLLVTGPVRDTGGASTLALTTMTGDITLAGNVSAANVVALNSAGAISQTGGALVARTLTGSAGTVASLTDAPLPGDQNVVSFFGPFSAPAGAIVLVDSVPLTINGALAARLIAITATGSISLASDITTGGLQNLTTTIPADVTTDLLANGGGAVFFVSPDASGNSSFTANSKVSSLNGTGTSLFVLMPAQGGNVGLTNLNAPSADFLLSLGSGNASGQVNVRNLVVLGTGGQVNFTNSTVQGFTGSAAALAAQSIPPANPAYLLDGCEIGVGCVPSLINPEILRQGVSVSSGISNIVSSLIENASTALVQSAQEVNPRGVPILNPMRDLSGGPLRDRQSDPDLLLPNVSEKDY